MFLSHLFLLVINQGMVFALVVTENNHVLVGHVFQTLFAKDWFSCIQACHDEAQCISYNYDRSVRAYGSCELNDFGLEDLCDRDKSLIYSQGFVFQQLRESKGKQTCSLDKKVSTCKEVYDSSKFCREDKAYQLNMDTGLVPVYCHMSTAGLGACGGGGWTLVMKIDGTKATFKYYSAAWGNKLPSNLPGGKTGLDTQETKLPTYWNTAFSKICLGMKINDTMNFIVVNQSANSLYSLIADNKYRATSLGLDTWKTLIGSEASLQLYCNREGFNIATGVGSSLNVRIGILGNNENECASCDSMIGFGAVRDRFSNTCGNVAGYEPDNGEKNIKAMGYILVQ